MSALEARIVRGLCRALDNEYAWVFIGVVTLALLYILLITSCEPFAGGAL